DAGKSYIYVQFIGYWSLEEYDAVCQKWRELIQEVAHPLSVIANFADSQGTPRDASKHVADSLEQFVEKGDMIVILGISAVLDAYNNLSLHIPPETAVRIKALPTIQAALDYLKTAKK
ncbi:MAG: hypothetical protein KC615_23235, partial [Anaerolineae bacterium]|nr:hypothetical protein [Anaerolineae bacterium]